MGFAVLVQVIFAAIVAAVSAFSASKRRSALIGSVIAILPNAVFAVF